MSCEDRLTVVFRLSVDAHALSTPEGDRPERVLVKETELRVMVEPFLVPQDTSWDGSQLIFILGFRGWLTYLGQNRFP